MGEVQGKGAKDSQELSKALPHLPKDIHDLWWTPRPMVPLVEG